MYLLDTNILSELIKRKKNPALLKRLREQPAKNLCTTCISVMKLRAGCRRRNDRIAFWKRIEKEILSRVRILPLGKEEALKAGDLIAYLYSKGMPVGIEDILIASVAVTHNLTLITANIKHFNRFPDLLTENWL